MKWQLYEIGKMAIGDKELTFLTKVEHIEVDAKDYEDTWREDTIFNSPEECQDKLKELFLKEKEEEWENLSINQSSDYTCLPIIH